MFSNFLKNGSGDYSGFPCPHHVRGQGDKKHHPVKNRSGRFFRKGFLSNTRFPSNIKKPPLKNRGGFFMFGGERGIRTLDTVSNIHP